jgi:hypothetical protein
MANSFRPMKLNLLRLIQVALSQESGFHLSQRLFDITDAQQGYARAPLVVVYCCLQQILPWVDNWPISLDMSHGRVL